MIGLRIKPREFGQAETIAERKTRLAYDRDHPWKPVSLAKVDNSICELQFSDMVGHLDAGHRRFVLIGHRSWGEQIWMQINPVNRVFSRPMSFRTNGDKITDEKMRRLCRAVGGVK